MASGNLKRFNKEEEVAFLTVEEQEDGTYKGRMIINNEVCNYKDVYLDYSQAQHILELLYKAKINRIAEELRVRNLSADIGGDDEQ